MSNSAWCHSLKRTRCQRKTVSNRASPSCQGGAQEILFFWVGVAWRFGSRRAGCTPGTAGVRRPKKRKISEHHLDTLLFSTLSTQAKERAVSRFRRFQLNRPSSGSTQDSELATPSLSSGLTQTQKGSATSLSLQNPVSGWCLNTGHGQTAPSGTTSSSIRASSAPYPVVLMRPS